MRINSVSEPILFADETSVIIPNRNFEDYFSRSNLFLSHMVKFPCVVGPCHHGMARPQVADRGTASNMEGSCE